MHHMFRHDASLSRSLMATESNDINFVPVRDAPESPLSDGGRSTPMDDLTAGMREWIPGLVDTLSRHGSEVLQMRTFTLAACGAIGAGKSTLLKVLEKMSTMLREEHGNDAPFRIIVQPEPTKEFGPVLAKFYNLTPEQMRKNNHVFVFQSHVYAHQLRCARDAQEQVRQMRREGYTGPCLIVQERCAFDATAVFMHLAVVNKCAPPEHEQLLQAITANEWVPDALLFVHASVDTCIRRTTARARGVVQHEHTRRGACACA